MTFRPICPLHGEEAVWRDRRGYWHCPRCLDIIDENYQILLEDASEETRAKLKEK